MRNAEEGLNSISPKDIQVLKALKSPPAAVKTVTDSVLILLQKPLNTIKVVEDKGVPYYRDSYATAYLMMNDGIFLELVQNYPKDNINDETIELLQPYLDHPNFSADAVKKASLMAAGLCTWVMSMNDYYRFARKVNPQRKKLYDKEKELKKLRDKTESIKHELNKVKEEMEEMQSHLNDAINEKTAIQNETQNTREKVKIANTLIRALASEKVRWMTAAGDYQTRLASLPGNVSVAACFLTYCGPLSHEFRSQLCNSVQTDLKVKGLPQYPGFDLKELLSTESERGVWKLQGLPGDLYSVENGILVTKALRWPLLIDPEGQGLAWITQREKDNMMKATTFGDYHFLQTFEECISHGRPLLVENVNSKLHPIIAGILDKRTILQSRDEVAVKIGNKDLMQARGFVLYMMTKLPNPQFSSGVSNQVTLINFKLSLESLQEQLYMKLVEKERPEFHSQKSFTVAELYGLQRDTAMLEEDILTRLYNIHDHGSILDDVGLMDVLESVKQIDRHMKEKGKIIEGLSKKIDQSCTEFRLVAKRASALYSVMVDLAYVNPMYNTSLQRFNDIFQSTIAQMPKENNIQLKVQNLMKQLSSFLKLFGFKQ